MIQLSRVTLASATATKRTVVTIEYDGDSTVVCSLNPPKFDAWKTDLSVFGERDVIFTAHGEAVDLMGYRVSAATPKREAEPLEEEDEAPVKRQKTDAPKVDTPKPKEAQKPKADTPKAEAPKPDTPKPKAKAEAKAEAPKAEAPKPKDAQKAKAEAKADTPKPKADTPKPKADTPKPKEEKKTPEKPKQEAPQNFTLTGGVQALDTIQGKGKEAEPGRTVVVHYTGRLTKNGQKFDSSVGKKPFSFRLGGGEVIRGWDVGVKGMKIGGKRTLTIPAHMGYGTQKIPGIPPNSSLTFDVELLAIK